MRELAELEKNSLDNIRQCAVRLGSNEVLMAIPAKFGPELKGSTRIESKVVYAKPFKACGPLQDTATYKNKIVVAERGDCIFADKVRRLQVAQAIGVIIVDNVVGSTHTTSPIFVMYGDGTDDVTIPAVFLFHDSASVLKSKVAANPDLVITIGESKAIIDDKLDDKTSMPVKMFDEVSNAQFEKKILKSLGIIDPGDKSTSDDSTKNEKSNAIVLQHSQEIFSILRSSTEEAPFILKSENSLQSEIFQFLNMLFTMTKELDSTEKESVLKMNSEENIVFSDTSNTQESFYVQTVNNLKKKMSAESNFYDRLKLLMKERLNLVHLPMADETQETNHGN